MNHWRARLKKLIIVCIRLMLLALTLGAPLFANLSQAQTSDAADKPKPAFMVVEIKVNDMDAFTKGYISKIQATLDPFGGHYTARRTRVLSLEGAPPEGASAILEFPSFEKAKQWYESAAYQEIVGVRHKTAITRIYIVEGLPR